MTKQESIRLLMSRMTYLDTDPMTVAAMCLGLGLTPKDVAGAAESDRRVPSRIYMQAVSALMSAPPSREGEEL